MSDYIAVDLDGTLAYYNYENDKDKPPTYIGQPIPKMVEMVKKWLSEGQRVKLFTARAATLDEEIKKHIDAWCVEHIGQILAITNTKDHYTRIIYDNIAVGIVDNTGYTKEEYLLLEISNIMENHTEQHKNVCKKLGVCSLIEHIKTLADMIE